MLNLNESLQMSILHSTKHYSMALNFLEESYFLDEMGMLHWRGMRDHGPHQGKISIALSGCMARVFTRLLTRRLGEYAEVRMLAEVQGGFRMERSCSDHIPILRGVYKLRKKRRRGTLLAFLT